MQNRVGYKKLFIFMGIISALALAVAGYTYISVKYNIGIPCLINKIFGVYCSGCGLTRACVAMLNLDFYQAFRYNAFSVILIPLVVVIFISFVWESIFDRNSFISKIPLTFWFILFGSVLIYGIIRNFIPALQPINV